MKIFTAPEMVELPRETPRVFIGGTIEQGTVDDWQSDLAVQFAKAYGKNVAFLNPRRKNWDATWVQSKENLQFLAQVHWELGEIEDADLVLLNFVPGSMSPISLLELGFLAGMNRAGLLNKGAVCCPHGFWRRGNVEIVCDRYRIPLVETLSDLIIEGSYVLERNHTRRMTPLPT